MNHQIDSEIMIWGPSTAINHFNSRLIEQETGLSTYNMGVSALFFVQNRGLIHEFISYSSQCRYLVITLSVFDLHERNQIFMYDEFGPYLANSNIYTELMEIDPYWVLKYKYVPFYGVVHYRYPLIKKSLVHYLRPAPAVFDPLKGFNPLNKPKHFTLHRSTERVKHIIIDDITVNKVILTIQKIPRNIKPIVVISPYLTDEQKYLENKPDYFRAIEKIKTATGVTVFNYFSNKVFSDSSLFFYNAHLNSKGADLFSRKFSQNLKQINY